MLTGKLRKEGTVHRNFNCEMTGEPCTDPRCTKTFCNERPKLQVARTKVLKERAHKSEVQRRELRWKEERRESMESFRKFLGLPPKNSN